MEKITNSVIYPENELQPYKQEFIVSGCNERTFGIFAFKIDFDYQTFHF